VIIPKTTIHCISIRKFKTLHYCFAVVNHQHGGTSCHPVYVTPELDRSFVTEEAGLSVSSSTQNVLLVIN